MNKFLIFTSAFLVIFTSAHAAEVRLTQADQAEISRFILEEKITILDRSRKRVIKGGIVALLIEGRRSVSIESLLSKGLPIQFIPKDRQVSKNHCWIDSQTGKSLIGVDIGPLLSNPDGSISVEAGSSTCVMGTESATYTFRRADGKWALSKVSQDLII